MRKNIVRVIFFIITAFFAVSAFALAKWNMPEGVTPMSQEIYRLHMAAFYVCCGIGFVVFSVLIYSLIKFRKSKGAVAAHFHEHLGVEILWTVIPLLILIGLAIPATTVLARIHNTDQSALTIKVTGYQWKWKYEYLDQGIRFYSTLSTTQDQINNLAPKNQWFLLEVDHPLVVPVNTKIKLLITADDVIHAWWVPELGIKQDAIPGFINENWIYVTKPGIYRGQCGELCGTYHSFMPIVVQAVPKEEFDQWVIAQRKLSSPEVQKESLKPMTKEELLTLGKVEYEKNCALCHQSNGQGLAPIFPPLAGSRVVVGQPTANIAFVLTGVPGTAMQAFGPQLDDRSLAAIITYTREAWGNDKLNERRRNEVVVQPADVAKVRK